MNNHPDYDSYKYIFVKLRDCYLGQDQIKGKGEMYLPRTQGMVLDGKGPNDLGTIAYNSYLHRAMFPDYFYEAVSNLNGMIHQKPSKFDLPPAMVEYLENATFDGIPLQSFYEKCTEELLITGRIGLFADFPSIESGKVLPKLSFYSAESCVNWDDSGSLHNIQKLNLVVLDETSVVRNGTSWSEKTKYRVLIIGEPNLNELGDAIYKQALIDEGQDLDSAEWMAPKYLGATSKEIPFVIVNTRNLNSAIDRPPLLGLANLCVSIYNSEADYRENLHLQGQDTLVTVGGLRTPDGDSDVLRTGTGSRIDVELGGDAKFIGVSSNGLSEQRLAIIEDKQRALALSGQFIDPKGSRKESGDALKIRINSQSASLFTIANCASYGIQKLLRTIAVWIGEDPESVRVTPNLEFVTLEMLGQEMLNMNQAINEGIPLSEQSVHAILAKRGLTVLSYEDEKKAIASQKTSNPGSSST